MNTDVQLQRDVLDELEWDPSIDAAQIGVTARDGIVTLVGHVPTHSQRYTAEQVAKRVHRVKGVANDLEVRPVEGEQPDDSELAAAAVHAIEWDAATPADTVKVVVSNGWIRLEGTARHRYEREAADRAVRHLNGVRGVTNDILVTYLDVPVVERPASDQIQNEIESALLRSALVNRRQITVEIQGHTAVLTGDVHSHTERDEAERIAWHTRGINEVENCISITPWGHGPECEWGY